MKKIKLCLICAALLLLASGCGDTSELKTELEEIELSADLPKIRVENCDRLDEADDEVYRQQIAACELYYEAYDITKTSDYIEKYKDDMKEERVAYYCNKRRKEMQLDIATQLHDNIYAMVRNVEDCDNIAAYLKRVNYDTVNFYDYYADYMYSKDEENALSTILTVFYERSNVLAFRFLDDNRDDVIKAAVQTVKKNARATEDFNMYISNNNEIIKALNVVYGGVPDEYAAEITEANVSLARKLLEKDNDLSADAINSLMQQLGEPTPTPEATETPEPTETPELTAAPTMVPQPTPIPTPRVTPTPIPRVTNRPAATTKPASQPVEDNTPAETAAPTETPLIYDFSED